MSKTIVAEKATGKDAKTVTPAEGNKTKNFGRRISAALAAKKAQKTLKNSGQSDQSVKHANTTKRKEDTSTLNRRVADIKESAKSVTGAGLEINNQDRCSYGTVWCIGCNGVSSLTAYVNKDGEDAAACSKCGAEVLHGDVCRLNASLAYHGLDGYPLRGLKGPGAVKKKTSSGNKTMKWPVLEVTMGNRHPIEDDGDFRIKELDKTDSQKKFWDKFIEGGYLSLKDIQGFAWDGYGIPSIHYFQRLAGVGFDEARTRVLAYMLKTQNDWMGGPVDTRSKDEFTRDVIWGRLKKLNAVTRNWQYSYGQGIDQSICLRGVGSSRWSKGYGVIWAFQMGYGEFTNVSLMEGLAAEFGAVCVRLHFTRPKTRKSADVAFYSKDKVQVEGVSVYDWYKANKSIWTEFADDAAPMSTPPKEDETDLKLYLDGDDIVEDEEERNDVLDWYDVPEEDSEVDTVEDDE